MDRATHLTILAAFVIGVASPSHARAEYFRKLPSGWTVTGSDGACAAIIEYDGEGETQLILHKSEGGDITLGLANYKWSSVPGAKYDVVIDLGPSRYSGGKSVGYKDGAKNGFITTFGDGFEEEFSRAEKLTAYIGETLIDDLSLRGSSAAVQALQVCHAREVQAFRADQAEKAKLAHIPSDPFAQIARPPIPKGTPGDWAQMATLIDKKSYVGMKGRADFKAHVSSTGQVTGCEITTSSGDASVDAATCDLVKTRGRFQPATDKDGAPVDGEYGGFASWKM